MRNILFVCVENSCRSQKAEGFFNKVGIDITPKRPKLLTQDMVNEAAKIITMENPSGSSGMKSGEWWRS